MRVKNMWVPAVLVTALVWGATPAHAGNVNSGDTLTKSVKLSSDLSCTGTGLTIGADGITVDLNGHTISSTTGTGVGIDNTGGYSNVTIKNGTIEGFEEGIRSEGADDLTLKGLHVIGASGSTDTTGAIHVLGGADLRIQKSCIEVTTVFAGADAIHLDSVDGATVQEVEIHGGFIGVDFFSLEPADPPTTGRVEGCTIEGCYIGILFANTDDARVQDNLIRDGNDLGTSGSMGVRVGLNTIGVSNVRIQDNEICGQGFGILGNSVGNAITDLRIAGNDVHDNRVNGMQLVRMHDSQVSDNRCEDNAAFGIVINAATKNVISGNDCGGNAHGISLVNGSNDNRISGNTANDNTLEGISLLLGTNTGNRITDNTATGNGTYDLFHNATSTPNFWDGNTFDTGSGADIDYP